MNGTEADKKADGPKEKTGTMTFELPKEVMDDLVEKARINQTVNLNLPNWSIEVEKTTKGYKWLVKGRGDDPTAVLTALLDLEQKLKAKFGEPDLEADKTE